MQFLPTVTLTMPISIMLVKMSETSVKIKYDIGMTPCQKPCFRCVVLIWQCVLDVIKSQGHAGVDAIFYLSRASSYFSSLFTLLFCLESQHTLPQLLHLAWNNHAGTS